MDQEDALIGAVAAGKYSFKRCIAQGRMARIYECTHGILSWRCIAKVLRPDWVGDDEARRGFLNEAKHLAKARHPAVVRILEFTSLNGSPASNPLMIILERLEGVTVEDLLWDGPLPFEWASLITAEVAHCLHAVHGLGIVHGGLRASEVFLTGAHRTRPLESPLPAGCVKILDWGDSRDLAGRPELEAARAADMYALERLSTQMSTGLSGKSNLLESPSEDVLLRFCPRCGSQDLDTKCYNSPWTAACQRCGATFSMMTVPIAAR